ncbi:hypothetical protein N7472_009019 [Penicillium cf. griseofulvum]|uniref:Uncharacterized protein n=1 Tax=Penicillium cf. griseofulvum TaxID=2972120 RepID=A0A9W9J823_9EURO|nr:hypothetical protein N7472_009019 [Penicillium cf. griseofulvum]
MPEEDNDDEPVGLAAMDLANDESEAVERGTQPESTNKPVNWLGQRYYQLKLRQGGCREEDREGRVRVSWGLANGGCTLWQSLYVISYVYGLQEWADSTLFMINIYLYTLWETLYCVIPTRHLASSSCFRWMKRLHSHTHLVRLQQVN